MHYLKEIFEALASRSRSHFFGSIMISFLGFNWQPIYFVIYAEVDILERFAYFDFYVKLWLPLIIGLALALITPALTWVGTLWAEKFTTKVKIIQAGAASSIAIEEMGFEQDRADKRAEIALTVDETLGKIEDEAVRDKFREDTLSSSQGIKTSSISDVDIALLDLNPTQIYLLERMYAADDGILSIVGDSSNAEVLINGQQLKDKPPFEYENAVLNLVSEAYIVNMVSPNNRFQLYKLTDLGQNVARALRNHAI